MKSEIEFNILDALSEIGTNMVCFGIAITKAGYGASLNQIQKEFDAVSENKCERIPSDKSIYRIINRLSEEGLVQKKKSGNKLLISITNKGLKKLKLLGEKMNLNHSNRKVADKNETLIKKSIIISFDIPEKERWKRAWLRNNLLSFEFEMIQRSVWYGKYALPSTFIEDLKTLNLTKKVEIFSIDKFGTLEPLIKT